MRTRASCPPFFIGLRLLKKRPEGLTAVEMTEEIGIAKRNMLGYIKVWRDQNLVYICGWRRPDGVRNLGDWIPVYGLKPIPQKGDVRKPKALSDAQKQARYRDKHRAEINAKRRSKRVLKSGAELTPFSHFTKLINPLL